MARRWPEVLANALEPGWVPTRMGGAGATGDLDRAHLTQAWLAVSEDPEAKVTAGYFYHQRRCEVHPEATVVALQDRLFEICRDLSGIDIQ